MMRREAVAFEVIALATMFMLIFARAKATWLVRAAVPIVSVLILLGSSYLDQRMQYDTPEWKRFVEYNLRRSLTQDIATLHYDRYSAEATKVGWSPSDFAMYDEFLADGRAPFNPEKQKAFYEASFPRYNEQINWQGITTTFSDLFKYYRYLLLVTALISVTAFLAGRRGWYLWPVPVITLVLILIQGHYFSSKDRLIVSGLTQIAVAAVAFLAVYGEGIIALADRKGKAMLFAFLALTVSGFTARTSLINARLRHDDIANQLAVFEQRVGMNANGKAIVNIDCYPTLVNDPFKHFTKPTAASTAHIVPLAWFATSPYQAALAKKAGLNPDSSLLLQLYGTPKRFFLGTDVQAGMIRKFMQEHGHPQADTISLGPFPYYRGVQLRVYRFGQPR
jgi:hypothetical protein